MLAALIVQSAVIAALIAMFVISQRDVNRAREKEREEWFQERQVLLNRIKPETAQVVEVSKAPYNPPAVSEFDDEDWFRAKEEELERLTSG